MITDQDILNSINNAIMSKFCKEAKVGRIVMNSWIARNQELAEYFAQVRSDVIKQVADDPDFLNDLKKSLGIAEAQS